MSRTMNRTEATAFALESSAVFLESLARAHRALAAKELTASEALPFIDDLERVAANAVDGSAEIRALVESLVAGEQ